MGKTNLCKHQFVPLPWLCRRKKTWGKGWFQTQGRLDLGIPALKSITFSLEAFLPRLHGNEQKTTRFVPAQILAPAAAPSCRQLKSTSPPPRIFWHTYSQLSALLL